MCLRVSVLFIAEEWQVAINGNTDRRPPMSLVLSGRVMSNALLLLACLHLVKQELRSTATPQPDIMSLRGENRFSFSSFLFFRYQAVSNTNFRAILTQLPCASLAPKLSFSLSQCFSRQLNFFFKSSTYKRAHRSARQDFDLHRGHFSRCCCDSEAVQSNM